MAGYTRQSSADIIPTVVIRAAPLNAEFDQLASAFSGATGHAHDGTTGNGPKIVLTAGVSGILPIANGGTNASTAAAARTNLGLAVGSDVQAFDAELTAIAALAGTGFYTQTGAGTVAQRALTAPAAGITIANPAGVAGNPTFALANDLSALEGLGSTGFAARTAADTWAQRTITGTAAEITVTNGDGVSNSPVISLPTALTFTGKTVTGGTFTGITDLAVADGGTGASSATAARANLDVEYNVDVAVATVARGHLYGLVLSNNGTDVVNDIDVAVGAAASDDVIPTEMVLGSAITKRLDATWVVGSGNGGLDTGAIANTTYHVFLIMRPDTGVVDALFSTSATAPTMPANYTLKRRIGSIRRIGGSIVLFHQFGDTFNLDAIVTDRSSTAAFASALLTVSVPTGISIRPIFSANLAVGSVSEVATEMGSPLFGTAATQTVNRAVSGTSAHGTGLSIPPVFYTNTSAQIYYAVVIVTGTISINNLVTHGWIDERGRV